MNRKFLTGLLILLLTASVGLTGCGNSDSADDNSSSSQTGGEDMVEDAKDAADDIKDDAKDTAEDIKDDVEDAADGENNAGAGSAGAVDSNTANE